MPTRSHKIRLVPNQEQLTALRKAAGCARYVYNAALEKWNEQYEQFLRGEASKPTTFGMSRWWTTVRPEWSKESYRNSQTSAILNLGWAWAQFWNRKANKPVFKKRGDKDSFYLDNDKTYMAGNKIHMPKIGKVKLREALRFSGKILGYTVSRRADQWFVSVHVEIADSPKSASSSVVGVDIGLKTLATASDGSVLENSRHYAKSLKRLATLNRKLSRQVKESARRERTRRRIARIHLKVSNKRTDDSHKFTTRLAKNHGTAVVEDINLVSMMHGFKTLRGSIHAAALGEIIRQLEYKMRVVKAPRFYPSTKTCSSCGNVKVSMSLSDRVYHCEACGLEIDRDLNAARNLQNMRWVTAPMHAEKPAAGLRRSVKRKLALQA